MKELKQNLSSIDKKDLIEKVKAIQLDGNRLVQIGCTTTPQGTEINYSFDKDYSFTNLRIVVQTSEEVPSISGIYWNAFIYENEIHDLFGIQIKGINVDYQGNFYKLAVSTPFASSNVSK